VGVNNRDLSTFEVDLNTSVRLGTLIPPEVLFVSESGIRSADDLALLAHCGVDAVLVGEGLMRSSNKHGFLGRLKDASSKGAGIARERK
jgi:indole-3-glycerol phosphate synthase